MYDIPHGLRSFAVNFENPTGQAGAGGTAASPLGVGRKGDPVRHIEDGEAVTLMDIEGNGTIRHIWMTFHDVPARLRGASIRAYWDGQAHPSIDVPVCEFFGFAHGRSNVFESCMHSVGSTKSMNSWMLMPFVAGARLEFHNNSGERLPLFYHIDYTLGDDHEASVGRLHGTFRRENTTILTKDFEILPERHGAIRYLGCVIGVRPLDPLWWGEGELKVYIDDDSTYPTIAGTGSEDYVGLAWGLQNETFQYHGCSYREKEDDADTGRVSMYRWHVVDPIVCRKRMRVTIQQIGHRPTNNARTIDEYKAELYEREDDWSAAAFWYQALPADPIPACTPPAECLANLDD